MCAKKLPLFTPIVEKTRLHEGFVKISSQPQAKPTRWMLERIYKDFIDPDGNFLEQFQTTAFDARFFELYLFAYLSRSGFAIDRSHPNPDFLVQRGGKKVAIEATTTNPSTSGVLAKNGKKIEELSFEEVQEYERNELPIRFGSPLFSKLKERYWELTQSKGLPFVLAIEAFHDVGALGFTDAPLSTYLYGQRHKAGWSKQGTLQIEVEKVDEHTLAEKVIPSGFFSLKDCEHISAVMFTNSGTVTKFARMGFQHGIGCDEIDMIRFGWAYNPDSNARDATMFAYNMDEPPLVESWGQGLVLCHNPRCLHPISRGFFPDAVECYLQGDQVVEDHPGWHPYSSQTINGFLGEGKEKLRECCPHRRRPYVVAAISKQKFSEAIASSGTSRKEFTNEEGWYGDGTGAFLGVIFQKAEKDWGCVVYGRNEFFQFESIASTGNITSREEARIGIQTKIGEILQSPQRIFPSSEE